ncbi:uncharacterized protein LOC107006392 [Solanum pennellii]|uniref:Uncharacterized protein LOC107006392 n=1 Tax=Solanum pennellii TaxID=28526 RepID=A0ABM1FQZ0_SOLPN|nr:uncharacterized protein LOC107006392 [Solanum pennellii]
MKQKSTESYREFAYRWRKETARVRPPMTEKEIVEVFVRVQEPEYYDRNMLLVGAKFAEIVTIGETIEDGLKSGKIARVAASPGSSGLLRKKREEVSPPQQGSYDPPRPKFEKRPSRNFTVLAESRTKLAVASLSVKEKKEFVIFTPAKVVAFVPSETLVKPKFVTETAAAQGRSHNKALHIAVICREKVVNRVLVNDGSGLNICPLSTLRQLRFDLGKLEQNQVNVRAFDGVQRDTLGAVNLTIQMGPAEFSAQFQVLDIDTSYNLLLGRSFIHMAGAVPSTLHQMMKLVWKNEELVIHGEGSHLGRQVPIIDEMPRGTDFYTVELVNATGEDLAPQTPMPAVYKMIAYVMLQNGFEPGFGLGRDSQGIIEPVPIVVKGSRYSLGYILTDDDMKVKKKTDQALTKPIPHLYQSFPIREYAEHEDLREGICDLFEEIDVVVEEEVELAVIRDAHPGEVLRNWTSTPILIPQTLRKKGVISCTLKSVVFRKRPETHRDDEVDDYEKESEEPDYVANEFRQFENQHKPNLEETETVNLGDSECVKEVKISTHLNEAQKEGLVHLLAEYSVVFVWEVGDMQGLSTDVVSHKLPINPGFDPVKQKTRKFKPELSLKIKKEIPKNIESRLVEVTQYPTWLANIVPVATKDGKIRICVNYRDLNKASPKDKFPLPNIHILIDNCARHEMQSFVDCYAGYHKILMDEEDVEKTTFITPWGVYHYRVMPFGLKNAGATYMRDMTTIFHDMIHKEIEVYVDDVIVKSRESSDHLTHLRKFFERLRHYNLKLNPAKCAFGVPAGKLLGFIVSRRGIELDPSKTKAIQELPPPKTRKRGEDISEAYQGWRLFFDGEENHQGKGIGAVLVSESRQNYPMAAKLPFDCTNNMDEYEACILDILPEYSELADALATIASMIKHPDTDYIDPLDIELKEYPVHYSHVEAEPDGLPWYLVINKYLESGAYPEDVTSNQKKSIRRMSLNFFLCGEILYKRTPDLGL